MGSYWAGIGGKFWEVMGSYSTNIKIKIVITSLIPILLLGHTNMRIHDLVLCLVGKFGKLFPLASVGGRKDERSEQVMELVWEPTVLYATIPGYWADVQWEGENDWLWRVHTEENVLIDWGHKETLEAAQQAVKEVLEGPKEGEE